MYRSGSIDIEDRSEAIEEAGQLRLKRVLQLNSPSPQILWFRALTGNVDQESPSVFRSGQMRLMLPAVESKIRAITDQPERRELLLRLPLPEGKFTLELRYEPDPK